MINWEHCPPFQRPLQGRISIWHFQVLLISPEIRLSAVHILPRPSLWIRAVRTPHHNITRNSLPQFELCCPCHPWFPLGHTANQCSRGFGTHQYTSRANHSRIAAIWWRRTGGLDCWGWCFRRCPYWPRYKDIALSLWLFPGTKEWPGSRFPIWRCNWSMIRKVFSRLGYRHHGHTYLRREPIWIQAFSLASLLKSISPARPWSDKIPSLIAQARYTRCLYSLIWRQWSRQASFGMFWCPSYRRETGIETSLFGQR